MYRERAVVCVANQNVPYNCYGKGSQPSSTHVDHESVIPWTFGLCGTETEDLCP